MFLPVLAFVFGTALVGAAALLLMPRRAVAIDRRLEELTLLRSDEPVKPRRHALVGLFKRIGEKVPRSPKEMGSLRLLLGLPERSARRRAAQHSQPGSNRQARSRASARCCWSHFSSGL